MRLPLQTFALPRQWLTAAAGLSVLLALSPWLWAASPWMMRVLVLAAWLGISVVIARSTGRPALGSALYLLASMILWFYSLAGAAEVTLFHGGATPIADPAQYLAEYHRRAALDSLDMLSNFTLGYGGASELMVIQFALALLAALLLVSLGARPSPPPPVGSRGLVLALSLALASALAARLPLSPGLAAQMPLLLIAVIAFAIARAALWCAHDQPFGVAVFLTAIAIGLLGFFGQGWKPLALMLPACMLLMVMMRSPGRRGVIAILTGLTLFTLTAILVTGMMRNTLYASEFGRAVMMNLRSKIAWRQADTMFCLASVTAKAQLGTDNHLEPGYFLGILVPRPLWPEKPNYSRGDQYAVDFCLFKADEQAAGGHSSSITLLGEPLLHGGWVMAVVAVAVIIVLLSALAWLSLRAPPAWAALALSLTGWLADFDQLTALYLGNGAKVALIVLPLAWACNRLERAPRTTAAVAGR